MKTLIVLVLITIQSVGLFIYGQDNCSYKQMMYKIDSISKAKKVENGMVKFHRVTSNGESSTTDSYPITKKQKFSFDGQFLVIGGAYFNLNKLLFFFIREDYIDFYFQGY